jgi:hypothetical protein
MKVKAHEESDAACSQDTASMSEQSDASDDGDLEEAAGADAAGAGAPEPGPDMPAPGPNAGSKRKAKEPPAEISVRVASPDGITSTVRLPGDATVSDLKIAIGKVRDATPSTMSLFLKGVEDALPNPARLSVLNICDGATVFLATSSGGILA